MKKNLLSLCAIFLAFVSHAGVFTVNNESGATADYTSLQEAVNAVSNDDTLYVQPSQTSYGNILLNKRLVIMGAGHNPTFSPYNSQVEQMTFITGSGGSILKGLRMNTITSNNGLTINNVVISGCFISSSVPIAMGASTHNNWVFEGSIIVSTTINPINLADFDANLIFRNCYLQNYQSNVILLNGPTGTLFDHCLLIHTGIATFAGACSGTNIQYTNSIIASFAGIINSLSSTCTACSYDNNIFVSYTGATFGSISGNGNFVNVNPQFVSFVNTGTYEYTFNLDLNSSSLGNNAASDGSDIGIYGGIFNFSPIGADSGSPQILNFSLESSTVPQGGTLIINLNANGSGQ
jgi:hypothetical protein